MRARSSGGKETHLDTPGYVISRRATKAIDGMATLCSGRCPSSPGDCHSRLHVRYNTENSSRKDGRIQTVDHALPKRGCYQATPHPDDYCSWIQKAAAPDLPVWLTRRSGYVPHVRPSQILPSIHRIRPYNVGAGWAKRTTLSFRCWQMDDVTDTLAEHDACRQQSRLSDRNPDFTTADN